MVSLMASFSEDLLHVLQRQEGLRQKQNGVMPNEVLVYAVNPVESKCLSFALKCTSLHL